MISEKSEAPEHQEKPKIDVSKLLAIIPPATELRGKKRALQERRIKIKFDKNLTKPIARIPAHIASELSIKHGDLVEIVIAGKKKAVFTAEILDSPDNIVLVYPADLEKQGVADNSIATIRKMGAR